MKFLLITCLVSLCGVIGIANGADQYRVAVAHLTFGNMTGTAWFTETAEGLRWTGDLTTHESGQYRLQVHELGDTSTCYTTGACIGPYCGDELSWGRNRGKSLTAPILKMDVTDRTARDGSELNFIDVTSTLRGPNNILGRSLVVFHEELDDEDMPPTGRGERTSCAVIGMHAPVEAWNNASSNIVPSFASLLLVSLMSMFKL